MSVGLDTVLSEWSRIVPAPPRRHVNELLYEEFPELAEHLRAASLSEISELPVMAFGAIGDAILWLTSEEFLWLLPILLDFGRRSDEPVYARSVVDRLRETVPRVDAWPAIRDRLSAGVIQSMCLMSEKCCYLGWDDERRRRKRVESCASIFRLV